MINMRTETDGVWPVKQDRLLGMANLYFLDFRLQNSSETSSARILAALAKKYKLTEKLSNFFDYS